MGNLNNPEQWAAMERLRFIERLAFWRGFVNRADVQGVFGVSQAQASADLQRFQQLNAGALVYHLGRKRYEAVVSMACVLHEPRLEDAIGLFLGETALGLGMTTQGAMSPQAAGRVAGVLLPVREADLKVQRLVFQAVLNGLRIRVRYASFSGAGVSWRWLRPHAFGFDGYRWHARAWCEKSGEFRDFVLSRMEAAELGEAAELPERDDDWETWEELVLRPYSGLKEGERKAVLQDFGMVDEVLKLRVRKAMRFYVWDHLRLPNREAGELRRFFEVEEG